MSDLIISKFDEVFAKVECEKYIRLRKRDFWLSAVRVKQNPPWGHGGSRSINKQGC